jgi:nicotinate-nucleotide adenylyltransferase
MARAAQAQCQADEVWFVPAGEPWQKSASSLAPAAERAHMVELAIAGVHSWRREDHELNTQGPNYTVDTLEHLSDQYPYHQWVWIIGADQLANLNTWQHWESLFDYARIGVVDRTHWGEFKVPDAFKRHFMQDRLFRIPMKGINISSTLVRSYFSQLNNLSAKEAELTRCALELALPTKVFRYLIEHNVY